MGSSCWRIIIFEMFVLWEGKERRTNPIGSRVAMRPLASRPDRELVSLKEGKAFLAIPAK